MEPNQDRVEQRATRAWQLRILPLMVVMLVAGAILFSTVSILEFRRLDDSLEQSVPLIDVRELSGNGAGAGERAAVSPEFFARLSLEAHATAQRYHLARTMLRARLWTRFIGFLTGMTLAMVGAAFVLGRLREEGSSFESSGAGLRLSMSSASPGLILAGLGTVLMGLCLVVAPNVQTSDGSIYLRGVTDRSPPDPSDGVRDGNQAMNDILNNMADPPPPLPEN